MKISSLFLIMGYVTCGVLGLTLLIVFHRSLGDFFRTFFKIIFFPWTVSQWFLNRKQKKREQKCKEILSRYFFIIGEQPKTIQYFEELIHGGISPKKLQEVLEANLIHFKNLEMEKELQNIDVRYRNEANLSEFLKEKEEILAQTKINLERLQNKEQLLGKVYDKMNKKNKSLSNENTDT